MRSLTLLLIPILLLSSCSIDWNDEKVSFDKKKYCAELKIEWVDEALISERFYSPSRDSCIYKYTDGSAYQKIVDALTKEIIETNQGNIERNIVVDEKIKELKWE